MAGEVWSGCARHGAVRGWQARRDTAGVEMPDINFRRFIMVYKRKTASCMKADASLAGQQFRNLEKTCGLTPENGA